MIYVDGVELADPNDASLRDRRTISADGIVIVISTIASDNGDVVADPEVILRAVGALDNEVEFTDEIKDLVEDALEAKAKAKVRDTELIQEDLHDELAKFIYKKLKKRPMVVPVVVEV